ncbi:MAG TPA: malate dehydrogenase [Candidatus Thermoplasmatota archaeon]|nr:malate dehydrogenase [Candidatus Thermoplasmatota archaeon]
MTKVGFVGAGTIGANSVFATLALTDRIDEVAVVDIAEAAAVGRALDLNTASVAFGRRTRVSGSTDYGTLRGSQVVVVSAGVPRKPGMTRADLLGINIKILKGVCAEVRRHAPECVFLLVTNPVDILLYVCWRELGFPRERVLGMTSLHDSARFTDIVRDATGDREVRATILGEHGETMFVSPTLSSPELKGGDWEGWEKKTRGRAMEIIERVGATAYAPGACTGRMVKAILEDTREEVPTGVILQGEYGHRDVATGVPAVLGRGGLVRVVEYDLTPTERQKLDVTVKAVKEKIAEGLAILAAPASPPAP